MEIEVELRDSPGQLSGVLETMGRYGGNIVTVVHDRTRLRNGRLPVFVTLDAAEEGVAPMLEALRRDYRVLRAGGARDTHLGAFLLIGHVIQNDLSEVTEAVFKAGAEVRRIRADVSGREAPSAVMVDLASGSEAGLAAALRRVREISGERGYTFVDAVGGGA